MPKPFLLFLLIICISSCKLPNTFIAEGFEPVIRQKKGDVMLSASVRPIRVFKFNANVAVADWLILRGGYSGYFGLDNFDFSTIFYFSKTKPEIFIAPTYNYQHNILSGHHPAILLHSTWFKFNCEYHSPGLALGFTLNSKHINHQFICKASRNYVSQYNMQLFESNGEDRSDLLVYDNENFNFKIEDFNSLEASYSLLWPVNDVAILKMQFNTLFLDKTNLHEYEFSKTQRDKSPIITTSKWHPISNRVNISVGLLISIPYKKYNLKGWINEAFK